MREKINAKSQRREGAKVLAGLHRVRARQPRTPSALGRRKTVSMSKLGSDSGTVLIPSRTSGWVPAHVARFPPASARSTCRRALFRRRLQPRPTRHPLPWSAERAKPAAEREATGEESSLAEPRTDRTAFLKGTGGRTAPLKGTPLRLCVFASLRFCLFCISLKQRNPLKNSKSTEQHCPL